MNVTIVGPSDGKPPAVRPFFDGLGVHVEVRDADAAVKTLTFAAQPESVERMLIVIDRANFSVTVDLFGRDDQFIERRYTLVTL